MVRGYVLTDKPPIGARVSISDLLPGRSGSGLGPLELYTRLGRSNSGGIARLQLPLGNEQWVLTAPDHVGYVLKDNQRNYVKGKEYSILGMVAPEGLLSAEGETWRRHRRRMQPAFKPSNIDAMAGSMTSEIQAMLDRWENDFVRNGPLKISQQMRDLTLRVVTRVLFSSDLDAESSERVRSEFGYLNWYLDYRMGGLVHAPTFIPTRKNLRYRRAVKALDETVFNIVNTRRRQHAETSLSPEDQDLLGMLLEARDEETQRRMGNTQLRDQILTLLIAGHETTANALSWAWYLLSQNADAEQALHRELADVLGGRTPVASDYGQLKYTRMILDEVLRLYPPAWLISRRPVVTDEIGDYTVPAGTQLVISPYVTHRHPDLWSDPERFCPERFDAASSAKIPAFAHFPFGGGSRQCLGTGFARMEAVLTLATVAQQYRLVSGSETNPSTEAVLTLRPRHGITLHLRRRGS